MTPRLTYPNGAFDAIDPGTGYYGWAQFDRRELQDCGLATTLDVASWRRSHALVIEGQRFRDTSRARPQNVIDLAFDAGRITGQYRGEVVHIADPQMWKGTVDGKIMIGRIVKRLDAAELTVLERTLSGLKKAQHEHVIDAIGIGLWSVGRMAQ